MEDGTVDFIFLSVDAAVKFADTFRDVNLSQLALAEQRWRVQCGGRWNALSVLSVGVLPS